MIQRTLSTISVPKPSFLSPEYPDPLDSSSSLHRKGTKRGSTTCIDVLAKDTQVVRSTRFKGKPQSVPKTRKPVEAQSNKSRRTLKIISRNSEDFQTFATLNYGRDCPTDDRVVKRHLDNISKVLKRKGLSFLWKQEFSKKGRPHIHLLIVGIVNRDELRKAWARIIQAPETEHLTHVSPILDIERTLNYIVKDPHHYSNRVPARYENMGRFHGSSGLTIRSETTIIVPEKIAAPMIRLLRKLLKARRKTLGLSNRGRDNGLTSMTLYDIGGSSIAHHLRRYHDSLINGPGSPVEHRQSWRAQ